MNISEKSSIYLIISIIVGILRLCYLAWHKICNFPAHVQKKKIQRTWATFAILILLTFPTCPYKYKSLEPLIKKRAIMVAASERSLLFSSKQSPSHLAAQNPYPFRLPNSVLLTKLIRKQVLELGPKVQSRYRPENVFVFSKF